jgi:hypothetical protein
VTTPSPDHGVFRWAWYRSADYLARFWVAAVVFSAVLSVIGAFVVLPPTATAAEKALAAVGIVVTAAILVVVGTYALALLAAPYQQRNALRRRTTEIESTHEDELATLRARIAELEAAPLTADHARRLREIAASLKRDIEVHRPLGYGSDADTWSKAFGEHFPLIGELLKFVDGERAAFTALRDRLDREAREADMGQPPWLLGDWLLRLFDVITARSAQGLLQGAFIFGWTESGGVMYLGNPAEHAPAIFSTADPTTDGEALKEQFEQFMRSAEAWPEASGIKESSEMRFVTAKLAIPQLEVAANTDPITSRCFLCRA